MAPPLFTIYGPFAIHRYGICLLIALAVTIWRITCHPWFQKPLTYEKVFDFVFLNCIVGVAGARVMSILLEPELYSNWYDYFAIWEGGLSSLGAIIAILCSLPFQLNLLALPAFPFLDLYAMHIPLFQAIMRLGCLSAGCCIGIPTNLPWGMWNSELCMWLHPTNLYSAAAHMIIFIALRYPIAQILPFNGQILGAFLICTSIERFVLDMWRADAGIPMYAMGLSSYNLIAIAIACMGIIIFAISSYKQQPRVRS